MPRTLLPRLIELPWGYTVIVKQVDNDTMDVLDANADGLWVAEDRTVILRRSLPIARKCYILTHEMVHVLTDWQHWALDKGLAKP